MSWMLFLDESGHDHRNMPYEVRGGIALRDSQLWPFVQGMQRLELEAFGCHLDQFRYEIKGSKLLDAKRFRFAGQASPLDPDLRRKHARGFLAKGLENRAPERVEFTAFGQACLEMARGIFELLRDNRAVLFAAAIPRSVRKPTTFEAEDYLRKDQVFLFERYFYHLDAHREHGLIVFDQVEKQQDLKFIRRIESYFCRTQTGRFRTEWVVPVPLFVASDLAYPLQAADVCIYCVNCGFRLPSQGMDATTRNEVAEEFNPWLRNLQFYRRVERGSQLFESFGIVFVPNPYSSGRD